MKLRMMEAPCEADLKSGCSWKAEDFYDEDGNLEGTEYQCLNCGRWRDLRKVEYEPPHTKVERLDY